MNFLFKIISKIYNQLTFKVGDFPRKVQIEVTNICNAKCSMCPLKDMKRPGGFMDFDLFKKIINQTSKHKLRRLILHIMGEPLLHPKIFEMIAYAKQKNPQQKIEFSTNASLLTKEKAQKLIDSGLDVINLSLDADSPEVYQKVRVGLDFEQTMQNIKYFLELRESTSSSNLVAKIQLIKLEENKHEWEGFIEKWQQYAQGKDFIKLYIKEMGDWGGYLEKELPDLKKAAIKIPCDAPFDSLDIFWNGDVSFCCFDYEAQLKVGNARVQSLSDIWQGKKMEHIRKKFLKNQYQDIPLCRNCEQTRRQLSLGDLNLTPGAVIGKIKKLKK